MTLVFILIFIQLVIVIPLAVIRGNIKRILLIAFSFEIVKFLFLYMFVLGFFGFLDALPNFIIVFFFYTVWLSEWLTLHEFGLETMAGKVAVFCIGVLWNIGAAFIFALCLPKKNSPTQASRDS